MARTLSSGVVIQTAQNHEVVMAPKSKKKDKPKYVSTSKQGVELSKGDVRSIFKRANGGKETQLEIAKDFKISTRYVSFIATGRVRHEDVGPELLSKYEVTPKGRYGKRKLKLDHAVANEPKPKKTEVERMHLAGERAHREQLKRKELTPEQREAKNAKDRARREAKKIAVQTPSSAAGSDVFA